MNEKYDKAVAIKYKEGLEAPIIMAKGSGLVAKQIVSEAEKQKVFVKEDGVLVDMMALSAAGDVVPENAWNALAQIFAFIMEND